MSRTPSSTEIAERLDLLELDVRNVLSYYSMLRTKPAGKYNVQVCTNISCMLRGGYEILDHCKAKLGIGHKEVLRTACFRWKRLSASAHVAGRPPCRSTTTSTTTSRLQRCDAMLPDLSRRQGKGREIMPTLVSHPDEVRCSRAASARALPTSTSTSSLTATRPCRRPSPRAPRSGLDHRHDEGLRPARTRRRGLPDRHEVVVCAQAVARSRSTFWSTATSPSPAPAKTTSSSWKTRTPSSKAR